MNRFLIIVIILIITAGCSNTRRDPKRVAVARAGDAVLYQDQIPRLITGEASAIDSAGMIHDYINKWAREEFLYQKAVENLSPELKDEIDKQIEKTRADLVIYQYQRQMMLEKMDTTVTEAEMEEYYSSNQESFYLGSNIIKALFIKLPVETPDIYKIRQFARSNEQDDLQQLESICYQFADKFDDFNERWIPFDRLAVELPVEIPGEEYFLRRTTFYEANDSAYIYFINIREYKLRNSVAPFEFISGQVKTIILNNRRNDFLLKLEDGIFNEALRDNSLTVY